MELLKLITFIYSIKLTIQNIVLTAQGMVRGIPMDGYISYVGIPYAAIDSIAGRFRQAGLAPVWTNIRESRDPHCSASSEVDNCLQLDVNVPNMGSKFPVFVWIKGNSGSYHPGKFVKQGIIVVIVRHRLGPLGFLCSKEYKIPGNAALKDILLALRWVRDNIVAFNGNPNKVTIGGQGFGAAMVEALMLSPITRGLFHGAILQSGTILAPWAFNFDAESRAIFFNMNLNSTTDLSSLSKIETIHLVNAAEELDMPYFPFGICIDESHKNEARLVLESPFDLLSTGDMNLVPMIMGYNSNEAYVFSSLLKKFKVLKRIANDVAFVLPIELQINRREMPSVTKQIKDMYFQENITMESMLLYHRDAYFLAHIHKSMRNHATRQPVYNYQFSHFGKVGVEQEPGIPKWGAAHSDELAYLFPDKGRDLEEDDGVIQQKLVQLWSNFIKHLNPTPDKSDRTQWEPFNPNSPRLLDISTNMEIIDLPQMKESFMWEDIYEKYYYRKRNQIVR